MSTGSTAGRSPSVFWSVPTNTTAALFNFNLSETPFNAYIPGEPADTNVSKPKDGPMVCHKCFRYATHTKKRCKQKQISLNYGGEDNKADDCMKELKCTNCEKGHMAG